MKRSKSEALCRLLLPKGNYVPYYEQPESCFEIFTNFLFSQLGGQGTKTGTHADVLSQCKGSMQ